MGEKGKAFKSLKKTHRKMKVSRSNFLPNLIPFSRSQDSERKSSSVSFNHFSVPRTSRKTPSILPNRCDILLGKIRSSLHLLKNFGESIDLMAFQTGHPVKAAYFTIPRHDRCPTWNIFVS